MMCSLSGVRWAVFCLLLWTRATAQSLHCSMEGPAEARHPVQGLLERFEAGPGCAARERGNKETHVIAVGRASSGPGNKVTVHLKPLSLTPSPLRALHLLLSSKLPISWFLEPERLLPNLPVLVQVSSDSSVQSRSLHLHVQTMRSLPFRPRALHRWVLKHHGNLSSLTHTTHGNTVYIRLGEDPILPPVCQLQSMFLSHNYMTSDLQQQEVQGCANSPAGGIHPEVHVIKLHSAGSGLCGSLQVEVVVSLLPPVVDSKTQQVVLILSSSVPVNWAIVSRGVQGHVTVHSSNSISPPYPPEPNLTISSSLIADLSSVPDLLLWASENGFTKVTSYTEADLANRFVIQLTGGGTGEVTGVSPLVARPPWAKERGLRQWLNRAKGGPESFTVQCEDGRLDVTVDQQILQSLSIPVVAVTLRDSTCQAQSNGSHFLLVFPVISCGTETLIMGQPRGVQYNNTVLLWREKPQTILTLNETEKKTRSPLEIHISCSAGRNVGAVVPPHVGPIPWPPKSPGPHLGPSRYRPGPALVLRLFVTEDYKQERVGPCVITADTRVHVEISARGSFMNNVEVKSCVVSPLSDPKKSRFWTVIMDGCSSDTSLRLAVKKRHEEEEEDEEEGDEELKKESEEPLRKSRTYHRDGTEERSRRAGSEEEVPPLRFSFILRPVFNDSMQFLHCSLRLCLSDSMRGETLKETGKTGCQGTIQIPPLVSRSAERQSRCEIRNLSRPMVVTQSISSLVPKLQGPLTGQRTKRLSVSPLVLPDPEKTTPVIPIGPLIGIVFTAFLLGVALMGGLWCIYIKTGAQTSLERGTRFTDQTPEGQNIWSQPSPSDQSSSCV